MAIACPSMSAGRFPAAIRVTTEPLRDTDAMDAFAPSPVYSESG